MKNNKLLIIGPHYDNFIKGSGEKLTKFYDEINVIIPKFKPFNFFNNKISIFKTVDRNFTTNCKNLKIHEVSVSLFLPIASKQLLQYLEKKQITFDVILSHFIIPYGYLGNKISKFKNSKSILIGHGFDIYSFPFKNILYKKIIKNILKNCNKIITVSNYNLKFLNKLGFKNKSVVIPNGFDSNLFKPLNKNKCKKKLNIPLDKKIILTIGNLVEVKNQKTIILAINELVKTRKEVICYIVGEGILRKKLQNQIEILNLEKYVKLIGRKPHNEIPTWINSADIFILPSYSESFGVVTIESFACGIPVISTINGGSEEIITKDAFGFIVKNANNYKEFSNLINTALNKKWNAKTIINYSKKYNWNKIVKDINHIIKR